MADAFNKCYCVVKLGEANYLSDPFGDSLNNNQMKRGFIFV